MVVCCVRRISGCSMKKTSTIALCTMELLASWQTFLRDFHSILTIVVIATSIGQRWHLRSDVWFQCCCASRQFLDSVSYQIWRQPTALTWSSWGCRRLADNMWLLAHDNNMDVTDATVCHSKQSQFSCSCSFCNMHQLVSANFEYFLAVCSSSFAIEFLCRCIHNA